MLDLIVELSEVLNFSTTRLVAIHKIFQVYSGVQQDLEANENSDFTYNSNTPKHVKLLNPQSDVD